MTADTTATTEAAAPTPVLVVGAHPDDPEFGCGGSIARWVREGRPVTYVVMTRGDKGSHDPTMDAEQLMRQREAEQRAAAAVLGVTDVRFLDCLDGEIVPTLALRGQLVRIIREVRPGTVVTHDPTLILPREGFVNHPDHRATGTVVIDACFPAAELHLAFPEHLADGLSTHKVTEILFWSTAEPTVFIDITETFALKVKAIAEHRSQVRDVARLEERMRERGRRLGQEHNMEYAEGFRRAARNP
jgi:LmbE family N-acetylglucosaminyl deacetylase